MNSGLSKFRKVPDFYPIDGKSHDAFIFVIYINGGVPPPPESPGFLEKFIGWISIAWKTVANFAFGEDENEIIEVENKPLSNQQPLTSANNEESLV